jgi:16S rRNA (adenine1518-N6/adenine1519-N6)-dimethyltransferase
MHRPIRTYQGHTVRKRFGQHFLVEASIIDAIIAAIAPQPNDFLVEIGPGMGALTGPLLKGLDASGSLHAIELDRDLLGRLQQRFDARLILHAGDALTFDFRKLAQTSHLANTTTSVPPPVLRLIGNLPYNISTPLFFHLLEDAERVIDQHFMVQKELAERMTAAPGTSAYGRLTVMLQCRYAIDRIIEVPPAAFTPPPVVDSTMVRMVPHTGWSLPETDWCFFAELVRAAFSQRRKTLRNALANYRARIDFDASGFDLTRRAQDVPVNEYLMLAQKN